MTDKELTDIITIDKNGLQVLDYKDIVDLLLDKYRQIYGYNIDLDVRTADARFIFDVATIINTGCNVIKSMYNNLNPNQAQGTFLDIISSFTNVTRKSATKSVALVKVTYTGEEESKTIKYKSEDYQIVSKDTGAVWTCITDDLEDEITLKKNEPITLKYQNSEDGAINATGFEWQTLTTTTSQLSLTLSSVSLGSQEESDVELRERRVASSNNGLSIDESLRGALMSLTGIKDAWVQSYAINSNEKQTFYYSDYDDPFEQTEYSVVILLKKDDIYYANDESIGLTIRNYLTPGILTKQYVTDNVGEKVYKYINTQTGITSSYYWYEPIPVKSISYFNIKLFYTTQFSKKNNYDNEMVRTIFNKIFYFLNNLGISQQYNEYQLVQAGQSAIENSSQIYTITEVNVINVLYNQVKNNGTYYKLSLDDYDIKYKDDKDNSVTLYLSYKG